MLNCSREKLTIVQRVIMKMFSQIQILSKFILVTFNDICRSRDVSVPCYYELFFYSFFSHFSLRDFVNISSDNFICIVSEYYLFQEIILIFF